MKCLQDLFVSLCQCLLLICSHFMAMLTKAVSWALGLEPAQVGDNVSKGTSVNDISETVESL